jgi:hypothetical protein
MVKGPAVAPKARQAIASITGGGVALLLDEHRGEEDALEDRVDA